MHILWLNTQVLGGAFCMNVIMTCTQAGGLLVYACGQVWFTTRAPHGYRHSPAPMLGIGKYTSVSLAFIKF